MKNKIKFILSLIFLLPIVNLYAESTYQLIYSEWSEEYPSNVDESRIVSKEVYLWYKDVYNEETGENDHIITEEYYPFLEGYTKIEESKKVYYRYILNDYVLVDASGKIQEDIYYCIKNFCAKKYLPRIVEEEKEDEKEELINPKTFDNIYISISCLLISFIFIILIRSRKINLVLSKCFK